MVRFADPSILDSRHISNTTYLIRSLVSYCPLTFDCSRFLRRDCTPESDFESEGIPLKIEFIPVLPILTPRDP